MIEVEPDFDIQISPRDPPPKSGSGGFFSSIFFCGLCSSSATAENIASPKLMNTPAIDDEPQEEQPDERAPFEKLLESAEAGDSQSQYLVGIAYLKGKDVGKSIAKAISWFEEAKNQDHAESCFELAKLWERGSIPDQRANPKKAWEHYSIAADLDHAGARTKVGEYYEKGWVVKKDKKKAVSCYEIAAKLGDANAQYRLGRCYEDGVGVAVDDMEAFRWYDKASKAGHARATYFLGYFYETGKGVSGEPDLAHAISLYKEAAKQQEPNSLYRLGVCFEHGKYYPKNMAKAKQFYEQAAKAKHPDAEGRLKEISLLESSVSK